MPLIRDLLLFPSRAPAFRLTATTTLSPQTVTIQRLTPTGASTTINWGDGSAPQIIAAGYAGTLPHVYTVAGTYPITVANPKIITHLEFVYASPFSTSAGEIGGLTNLIVLYLGAMPGITIGAGEIGGLTNLTNLTLVSISGATVSVGEIGGLTNLTYLYLVSDSGVTVGAGEIGGLTNLTVLYSQSMSGVTISAGEIGGLTNLTNLTLVGSPGVTPGAAEFQSLINIRTIRYENLLNQVAVDGVIQNIWLAKANYTWATPSLDLLGGGNAAPSGVYASVCPPTTGNEWKFDLVNGICTAAGPEWTVQTA